MRDNLKRLVDERAHFPDVAGSTNPGAQLEEHRIPFHFCGQGVRGSFRRGRFPGSHVAVKDHERVAVAQRVLSVVTMIDEGAFEWSS